MSNFARRRIHLTFLLFLPFAPSLPKKKPPLLRMVGWTLGEGWFCRMGKREGGREGGRCLKCALNPLPLYPRRPFILRAACVRALSELSAAARDRVGIGILRGTFLLLPLWWRE